jgi:hypothetical protein
MSSGRFAIDQNGVSPSNTPLQRTSLVVMNLACAKFAPTRVGR